MPAAWTGCGPTPRRRSPSCTADGGPSASPTCSSPRSTRRHRRDDASAATSRSTSSPAALGEWYHPAHPPHRQPVRQLRAGRTQRRRRRDRPQDHRGHVRRHGPPRRRRVQRQGPSKVDRSGAYFTPLVARELVQAGLAKRAEIQVAYAIGVAQPISVKVDTFGTGDERAAADFVRGFDFRPAAIIERLDLLRPIYRATTNYGHFGKPTCRGSPATARVRSCSRPSPAVAQRERHRWPDRRVTVCAGRRGVPAPGASTGRRGT
jgi:hypothetical protein